MARPASRRILQSEAVNLDPLLALSALAAARARAIHAPLTPCCLLLCVFGVSKSRRGRESSHRSKGKQTCAL